ncbi:titin [Trichonephila inaurata madagascariensis]|uniref:Titin n=1 Tax=Trichonephila inaurata madagascariensis TaxID=2747483 RepID=A0A8X6Y1E4_9ARAC|nr:titin [Trichonephila inaurata madagascariensis]
MQLISNENAIKHGQLPEDVHANEKDSVQFDCVIEGTPQPNIRWFKDHNMIAASEDYQMSYSKGVAILCIPEAYPEDSGKYTCTATNIAGCKTASAYLSVQPEEEGKSQDTVFVNGYTVLFRLSSHNVNE